MRLVRLAAGVSSGSRRRPAAPAKSGQLALAWAPAERIAPRARPALAFGPGGGVEALGVHARAPVALAERGREPLAAPAPLQGSVPLCHVVEVRLGRAIEPSPVAQSEQAQLCVSLLFLDPSIVRPHGFPDPESKRHAAAAASLASAGSAGVPSGPQRERTRALFEVAEREREREKE